MTIRQLTTSDPTLVAQGFQQLFIDGFPAPPLRAAPWHVESFELPITHELSLVSDMIELQFEPIVWRNDPVRPITLRGTMRGVAQFSDHRGTAQINARFEVVSSCDAQSVYFRHCGEDPTPAPNRWDWVENNCPQELVAAFAPRGPRTVEGDDVRFGSRLFRCVTTRARGSLRPRLCFAEEAALTADGCTWRVQALTDGQQSQFVVSAWAQGSCAPRTCDSWW